MHKYALGNKLGSPGELMPPVREKLIQHLGARKSYGTTFPDRLERGTPRAQNRGQADTGNGVDGKITIGDVENTQYIQTWVVLEVDDQIILSLANSVTTAVSVVAGELTFGASLTVNTIFIDGVSKTAAQAGVILNDNTRHLLYIDYDQIDTTNLVLFTDGTSFGNVTLFDLRIGDTTESVADVLLVIDTPNYLHGTESGGWHLDEEVGVYALNSIDPTKPGTATGGVTVTTQDVVSFHNEVGYTLADGATFYLESSLSNLIADGAKIPKVVGQDKCASYVAGGVLGDLQFKGVAPKHGTLVNSYCIDWDGISDFIRAPWLTGNETVISSGGTSTPSVSLGRIDFTAGTCWNLILSNGDHFPLEEGDADGCYDIVNGKVGRYIGGIDWITQDDYHYNKNEGFGDDTTLAPYADFEAEIDAWRTGALTTWFGTHEWGEPEDDTYDRFTRHLNAVVKNAKDSGMWVLFDCFYQIGFRNLGGLAGDAYNMVTTENPRLNYNAGRSDTSSKFNASDLYVQGKGQAATDGGWQRLLNRNHAQRPLFTQNNASIGIHITSPIYEMSDAAFLGCTNTDGSDVLLSIDTATRTWTYALNGGQFTYVMPVNLPLEGLYVINRPDVNTVEFYKDGILLQTSVSVSVTMNTDWTYFHQTAHDTVVTDVNQSGFFNFVFSGGALTSEQIRSLSVSMKDNTRTFMCQSYDNFYLEQQLPNEDLVDVYILLGQSNAQGGQDLTHYKGILYHVLSNNFSTILKNSRIYDIESGAWEDMRFTVLSTQGGFSNNRQHPNTPARGQFHGPEIRLADEFTKRRSKKSYIFKCTSGGSYLADTGSNNWDKDSASSTIYAETITVYENAMSALTLEGKTPTIKGVIWIQGESDALLETKANAYEANLTALVANLRSDFGVADLPVVCARLSTPNGHDYAYKAAVNSGIDAVALADANVYAIDTDDLTFADASHYDSVGLDDLALLIIEEFENEIL